jgi:hypothetical protein
VISSIHDQAFGGGPLTLSELALGLDKTFCVNCYTGIITAGHMGGKHSKMRTELRNVLNKNKTHHLMVADVWSEDGAPQGIASAPLVTGCHHGHKHECAKGIREWYKSKKGVHINPSATHMFDDDQSNIDNFEGSGYNARQVSCKSRDNTHDDTIGWCGGIVAECVADAGIHKCAHHNARRQRTKEADGVAVALPGMIV